MQEVQGGDEGAERPSLSQAEKMALPALQARQDAIAEARLNV